MARDTSPRFVHEFELVPTPAQVRILRVRLDLARQLYNAMLGKARDRLQRVRRDPRWHQARTLRRAGDRPAAKALYQAVTADVVRAERLRYEPDFAGKLSTNLKHPASGVMTRLRQAHFRAHLDYKSVQALATRAYRTVDHLRFQRPTRRRDGSLKYPRARFVRKGEARAIDSTSIHWRGQALEWNSPLHPLQIPVRFDPEDKKGIQAHALALMQDAAHIVESKRVLARTIRGQERWYVQVTLKGEPAWKAQYPPAHGKRLGIDFGPSQIGVCWQAPDGALRGAKLELTEGLRHDYARIRRLQRYLDRSRRAMNPGNYREDGTIKRTPGQRLVWRKSKRSLRAEAHLADLWRKYAARRKNQLGRLANQLLTRGTLIQIEALSYKAWQKTWGKSIGRGAPGLLVAMLRRKIEQVSDPGRALKGGELIEFPTRHTKLSQLCHGCGSYTKKPLKQRIHRCVCGIGPLDRDIYSAFLAYHYDSASKTLDMGAARAAFEALQCLAVGVEGIDQAACASAPVPVPSPGAHGDCGGSSADQALLPAEALADQHARERPDSTLTFQDFALVAQGNGKTPTFQAHASIAARSNPLGDARSDPSQAPGPALAGEGHKKPARASPRRRSSQDEAQLSLFPGLGGPGG
jgi:transposase